MNLLTDFNIPFTKNEVDVIFSSRITKRSNSGNTLYFDKVGKQYVAIRGTAQGLWAPVTLFVVLDMKNRTLKNLSVVSHSETPGLGARIEEPWFLDQFIGLDISKNIRVGKKTKNADVRVDAITGATVTSHSVELIINDAVNSAEKIISSPEKR